MNQSLSYMQTFTAKSTAAIKTGKVVHRKIFVMLTPSRIKIARMTTANTWEKKGNAKQRIINNDSTSMRKMRLALVSGGCNFPLSAPGIFVILAPDQGLIR